MARGATKVSQRAQAGGGKEVAVQPSYSQPPVRITYGSEYPGPGGGWFGPGNPMPPTAPPSVEGRRFDFVPGYNLTTRPRAYEPVGFAELRAMAYGYDMMRIIIETRKDQLERLPWDIVPKDPKAKADDFKARIDPIRKFLKKPDRRRPWRKWLRELVEDVLVIDAPSVFRRRTMDGKLYALQILDGATIKVVLDGLGNTPEPPFAAYQQILKGLPARNYTTDQLLYQPRNQRSDKVYGFSPVEQVVMTVNIALRRQIWQLEWFTEGNMPEMLLGTPESWTAKQVQDFQTWFDATLSGQTGARRRAYFVPGDVGKTGQQLKETELFGAAEEWLARVMCFAFSVSPQQFVKMMNRATGETAKEQAEEEGTDSLKFWVKDLIDQVIEEDFGADDLEFVWTNRKEVDPKTAAEIQRDDAKAGIITVDEVRGEKGLQPYGGDASKPMTLTATGWVPLQGEERIAQATAMAKALPKPEAPGGFGDDKQPGRGGGRGSGDGEGKPKGAPSSDSKKAAGGDDGSTWAERPLVRRVSKSLAGAIARVFADVGASAASQVAELMGGAKAAKVEGSDDNDAAITPIVTDATPGHVAAQVDLSGLNAIVDVTAQDLADVGQDAGFHALAQVGAQEETALVNQVNDDAVAWARDRAAELVGKRWAPDGTLIDNPNPRYAITDSTRDMIRETIRKGLADNIGIPAIADSIKEGFAFSEERAALIANTEVRRSNSYSALEGYKAAREIGVPIKKQWSKSPQCVDEEICIPNALASVDGIDLDEEFPSGDQAPPGHPNCRCALTPVVGDDES